MVKLQPAALWSILSLLSTTTLAQPQEFTHNSPLAPQIQKRTINQTEYAACQAIQALDNSSTLIPDVLFLPYTSNNHHYMLTSSQPSTCIYTPTTPSSLASALSILGQNRIRFAISCSGHASNQGFSSTTGVHISMKNFQNVTVDPDNSYVDIGGGIAWSDVYAKLDETTVNVVGGRVPGPGIGGFVTGGGGYSWISNQYGLTGDTLISAEMVLPNGTLVSVSEESYPDLFWAIKGGGNQFGIIYSFRLRAVPRPPKVYGGIKLLPATSTNTDAFMSAIANFSATNVDPKAQIIPATNYLLGIPLNILIAYYDGIPTYDPFSMFNQTLSTQTFTKFVNSLGLSNLQQNQRGTFNTVSLRKYTPAVLAQIANQTKYWGEQSLENSGTFISYDIEPFLNYSTFAKDAAWSHTNNALPLNLYFAWTSADKDEFWQDAMLESSRVIADTARNEGQDLDELLLYPNYAMVRNPVGKLYGGNEVRIEEVRRKYDPDDVMFLTDYFRF